MKRWTVLLVAVMSSLLILCGLTTPSSAAESTASSFTVQKWHTGIWISWDKSTPIKSALVSAVYEDDLALSIRRFRFRNTIGESTYIPLAEFGPATRKTILVSIIAMDFTLDGVTEPPACQPFTAWPADLATLPPGSIFPPSPAGCLSESIYRVFIDISSNSTKPTQLPGMYFGQRPRNLYYVSLCPVGQSCQLSNPRVGDVQMGDSTALRTAPNSRTILFIDAIFFGLPKYTDVFLEVKRRDGKWQNLGGQELSTSYSYFRATSIPVQESFTTKYRFRAWAKRLKKNVLITPTFSVDSAFSAPTQSSPATVLEPISWRKITKGG